MIVYGSTLSPFVRKVMVVCAEKGLAPELKPAGMGQGGPEFAEASPFGKMPAFRDGDFTLCDSSAIIHYLEAKYPEAGLIPEAPEARGRTIWFEEFADTIIVGANTPIFFNRFVGPRVLRMTPDIAAAESAEREAMPKVCDYLERVVPEEGFLVEDRLTLADIAVASPLANLALVGSPIDPVRYPRVTRYLNRILERPSFATILEQDRKTIAAMGGAVREAAAA